MVWEFRPLPIQRILAICILNTEEKVYDLYNLVRSDLYGWIFLPEYVDYKELSDICRRVDQALACNPASNMQR